jgi:hypothetical protein
MSKTKKKKNVRVAVFLVATVFLLLIPLSIQLISAQQQMWRCSEIGCAGGGCSGDVMSWDGCTMECKTGSTTTTACYYYQI